LILVKTQRSRASLDAMILFSALFLASLRGTMFVYLHPDISSVLSPAWIEIVLWLVLAVAILFSLTRRGQMADYWSLWRRNWLPALFIVLAFLSVLWSLAPAGTWFASLELLFATLVGSYFGMRLAPEKLLGALFWYGAILLILSVALVFGAPPTGTMYWAPFDGAWRGLFWHRNHLASLTALLSVVFLCRTFLSFEGKNKTGFLDAVFYLISLIILYFAESATGQILFLILNFLVLCIWLWLKIYPRLGSWHYVSVLGVFTVGSIWLFSNLDIVFGLFNRNTTLTGRVGLWQVLFRDGVSQHPWWGHGFGAFWTLDTVREQARLGAGWTSQPLIADNGFLDILLHLGLAGFGLLLLIVLVASLRSIRCAFRRKTVEDFFPVLFMVYVIVANIPFSLFAETEVFTWFLMIVVLFMTTPPARLANEAA
jgi:exopolysaccharide production protein ExoQ